MKLLLLLLIAISGNVFADQTSGNEERRKQLKRGVMWGGAIVGGIVGWRVLRWADYKMFDIYIDGMEKVARRSRMSLARFTKVNISDPPIYRLTAPDGSQHHILGTMHISNLSLSDLPKDSKLSQIVEQANILIPEIAGARFTSALRFQFSLNKVTWRRQFVWQQRLSEQLGDEHWQKLTQMIAEKPDLKPFEQPLGRFMDEIDSLDADDVYSRLSTYGQNYATPIEGLKMDFQLIRYGREHGKTLIGLETFKQARASFMKTLDASNVGIDDLKRLIDKGGIDYVTEVTIDSIRHYADGNLDESYKSLKKITPLDTRNAVDTFMLDQRNIAWVESGKIQKNCVNGNNCLIFVGFAHLTEGSNTLIKLLQKQGYKVERI